MAEHPTVTEITQQRMPPAIVPYFRNLARNAQNVVASPYQAYGGQRLAGFSKPEVAAQQGYAAYGMSGGPNQMGAASQYMGAAGQGLQGLAQKYQNMATGNQAAFTGIADRFRGGIESLYGRAGTQATAAGKKMAGMATAAAATPSMLGTDLSEYMNPYTENVMRAQERAALGAGRQQMSDLSSRVAMGGAYGGDRHRLMQEQVMRDTRQEMGGIRTRGLEKAYQDAQGMFEADRASGYTARDQQMAAQQAAENYRGQGLQDQAGFLQGQMGALGRGTSEAQLGLSGEADIYRGLGDVGGQFRTLGQQEQDMQFDRLAQVEGVGQRQRGLQQAGMDMGYGDFQRQRDYPKSQLGWFGNILNALPAQLDTTQSTFQQQPGIFQSVLSTGIGGLGLYNQQRDPR